MTVLAPRTMRLRVLSLWGLVLKVTLLGTRKLAYESKYIDATNRFSKETQMSETAELKLAGQSIELPVVVGTENE